MENWIRSKDINGNLGWLNIKTNQFRYTYPQQGTIQQNTVKSVGFRPHVKSDKIKATHIMANSYNLKQHKVHNYMDTTQKLQQRQQTTIVDKYGNPHNIQTDYTPKDEAPMEITGPEKWYVEIEAIPGKAINAGVKYLFKRLGNNISKNIINKEVSTAAKNSITNETTNKLAFLRNLRNSLGTNPSSNLKVFKFNNTNYNVDKDIPEDVLLNYFNSPKKSIEWYPENYEAYTEMLRHNGYRYLDQKVYDDGVKQLATDLASNKNLLYSKDFLSKVEAAAKKEDMNSFDLLQDIQTASRMLNFKPLPAKSKSEIPLEDLVSDNFSTLNKNISGVYNPRNKSIYMGFDTNGKPLSRNALSTWLHENEHYFQDLFSNAFNSKSNTVFLNRGYHANPTGLKFMSLVDNVKYPEASSYLAEKGSTNKENLLFYYDNLIKKGKYPKYEDVNNLINKYGEDIEKQRLSNTEYASNAYDQAYINSINNEGNYNKAVKDLTEKYKKEYGKDPNADELLQYGKQNQEFLHKYQQDCPTLPEEINDKTVWGKMDALKYGLGLIPTAGIIVNKHKNGGKVKIHIKKKNEGKFTSYCGGKVTQACIDKAKASGNSKLVKRAVFAENSRKWKHQNGGILKGSMGMEAPIDPPDDSFVQLAQKSGSGDQAASKLKKIYYDAKSNGATEQQAAAATITAAFESHGNYLAENGKYKGLGQWDPSRYPGGYLNQIKTLLAKNKSQWSRNGYSQFTNPNSTPADTTRVYTRDFIRGGNPTTRAKIAQELFGMTNNY